MGDPTHTVFIDTETLGLNLRAPIWEIGLIVRRDGVDTEHHHFVRHNTAWALDLPESFRLDYEKRYNSATAITERAAAQLIRSMTIEARIVGAVPNFDTERFAYLMDPFGLKPEWHHRLVCVETLTAGHLKRHVGGLGRCAEALGLTVDPAVAHTAMGDVRLARDIYDAVMGGAA